MKNMNTRTLTRVALLVAIELVMKAVGLGSVPMGPLYMSFLTLPIAVGAITMGPAVGAILGGVFGAVSAAFAPGELTLTGLHTGLHLLAHLRNAPPDAALHAAARAQGVRLSLLSDYDLTGSGSTAPGTFVLGYGSLADDACPSVGETLKKLCTAARDSSLRV